VALIQRRAEPCDPVEIGEAERHQRGRTAVLPDLVIELFEASLRARDGDDVRPSLRQSARSGIADAARGAGNKGDTGGEGSGHSCVPRLLRRVLQTWVAGTSPAWPKLPALSRTRRARSRNDAAG